RGHRELRWADDATCGGRVYPAAWPIGDADVALVRESATEPPALVVTGPEGERVVADLAHPGTAALLEGVGSSRWLSWEAPDGGRVHGRLSLPSGPGPHPLLVHVHGGPVWTSRNTWLGRMMFLPLALSRGYAVLQPNPRGSSGWGHAFRDLILGDMGGADVDDILTGVDAAVASAPIDADRIGVTGGSYG